MSKDTITAEDGKFVTEKIMPYFGISRLQIEYSPSRKTYPDIWVTKGEVPVITVTDEWKRQSPDERRKRLVHEVLHLSGLSHNANIGYTSRPETDTLSKKVYSAIMRHTGKPPKQLKLSKNLALRRRK